MKENVIELFRCPEDGSAPDLVSAESENGEIISGVFLCPTCSSKYQVNGGVPIFLPQRLSEEVDQVRSSYSMKWDQTPDMYDENRYGTQHQHEWYLTRYHWNTEDNLRDFLQDKEIILDAGCGLGRDIRWYAMLQPDAIVVGADLSTSVFHAYEKSKHHPNLSVVRADLNKVPFAPETFDFVVCEQVLPAVENPRASTERLWSLVKPGGHFAFYLYKVKTPIHEFTDDYLRDKITKMSPEDAWEASANVTRLGKALSDLQVVFDLPNDIPELGIKAGRYNLQRFMYYNFIKCFWNDNMTFEENNVVNFDWYHPAYTYRHSVEEAEEWIRELGMKAIVIDTEDPSGISVVVQKRLA
jgi:SAM-dependent methyltransferase/uncharacterized protein YbaR (Trm112 family)